MSYRLCKTNLGGNVKDKSKSQQAVQRLQNAFTMSILMGLTWVFGFFAIEDAKFVFTLIFCLCNSFQGLVLFLLFCARQEDVRKTLRPYIRRLCCKSATPASRSQTASTGVQSSTSQSKSPYSDMDFSASAPPSKSPYSEMDFSAAVPMSTLSADNPTNDTTVDAIKQKAEPAEDKESELSHDTKVTSTASDSVTIVQVASGSDTHNASDQEEGEVLSSSEKSKLLQQEAVETESCNENKVQIDKEMEGLPSQKDDDIQNEKDGELSGQA